MTIVDSGRKKGHGLVLGKFMPPHKGHQYLVQFAQSICEEVSIVVGSLRAEPISGEQRYQWMKELYPNANVLHLTDENPQLPEQDPDFWEIWKRSLTQILPSMPDFVFAGEEYGEKLAQTLGATYIPLPGMRELFPVSGSAIRADPFLYWESLPDTVRPYFVKRVCIFGPESTGKSTLANDLAQHYSTKMVPEFARNYLERKGGEVRLEDIPLIARGQRACEEAIANQANRVMFCDTDMLTTALWSEVLFGSCPQWVLDQANQRSYDLYLLTGIDVPWVEDSVRYLPNERESFYARCRTALSSRGRAYIEINGSWDERFKIACAAVQELLHIETKRAELSV